MAALTRFFRRRLLRRRDPAAAEPAVPETSPVAEAPAEQSPVEIAPNDPLLAYFQSANEAVDIESPGARLAGACAISRPRA